MKKAFFFVSFLSLYSVMNLVLNAQVGNPEPSSPPTIQEYRSRFPVVDYDVSEPANNVEEREKRKLKNKRYDNRGWVVAKVNPNTAGVGCVDCICPPLAIPANESKIVVIGEIISGNAFLSNDKGGVYSEYAIRIEEILKADSSNKVVPKDSVIADRAGGAVRYPNGQKVFYGMSEQELPRVGKRYLLFLNNKDKSPNYNILVAYELNNGRVHPLDIGPPEKLKEIGEIELIKKVRETIKQSPKIPPPYCHFADGMSQ